jgi:hypothetical protein
VHIGKNDVLDQAAVFYILSHQQLQNCAKHYFVEYKKMIGKEMFIESDGCIFTSITAMRASSVRQFQLFYSLYYYAP